MTNPAGSSQRSLTERLMAVDDVRVSRRVRLSIALPTVIVGWAAVAAWIVLHREAPARPDVLPLAVLCGTLALCHLVNALIGERPRGRVVLRWTTLVVVVHLAAVSGLVLMVVPESRRLDVALDAALIAPGLGLLYAGIGVIALVIAFAVCLGLAATLDLTKRAVRGGSQSPLERARTLSLAACILGAVLAFTCISIAPRPLEMGEGFHRRGAGVLVAYYLLLQALGIRETAPGWYPMCINILFVVSLILIAQLLLRPLWSRLMR